MSIIGISTIGNSPRMYSTRSPSFVGACIREYVKDTIELYSNTDENVGLKRIQKSYVSPFKL